MTDRNINGIAIRTEYWRKPIPTTRCDWIATEQEYDLGSPSGYGPTEADAITELLNQVAERDVDHCPQCGEPTKVFFEGYCKDCRDERQSELDEHNASFDRWERMTDGQRSDEIKQAIARAAAE